MKKVPIQIMIEEEKLDAIRQFTPPTKPPLEDEIVALVEKVYRKNVPGPVRTFVENRLKEDTPSSK